jgi:hypothetical protein
MATTLQKPSSPQFQPARARVAVTLDGTTVEVETAKELAVLLSVVPANCMDALLQEVLGQLDAVVTDGLGLNVVLRALAPQDQYAVLQALQHRLAGLLQDGTDLRETLLTLAVVTSEPAKLLRRLRATDPGLAAVARKSPTVQSLLSRIEATDVLAGFVALLGTGLGHSSASAEQLTRALEDFGGAAVLPQLHAG